MQMQNIDRTRLVFIAIVGVALLVICVATAINFVGNLANPEATPTTEIVTGDITRIATPSNLQSPDPVFAPAYDPNDGKPTYICGADTFGSYFVLQQMQMSGKDVENGFHLGIVPFALDGDAAYDVSEEQRTGLLSAGIWDCLLTTLDSVALKNPGVITAVIDESAGADQLWGREINTINDLNGARIAFARGSVGEYFTYYTLSIAGINPRFDVTLVPQDSVEEAVAAFNEQKADAVSAWEPNIYEAEQSGGVPLLSSNQMRVVIDVIVTSRQSIAGKTDLVQAFHNAWFATLKDQLEQFDTAAANIAAWGHNDWSFVYPETASDDLRSWLGSIAQADLGDNAFIARDPAPLYNRLEIARRVWSISITGSTIPDYEVADLVDTRFIERAAQQANLQANGKPINDTFSISAQLDLSGVETEDASTLAVLPCRKFDFLPESTELTLEARRRLDECVIPTLSQSIGLFLEVKGSSAWPQNDPPYTEAEILQFAEARAQSVVDYLVSQGIDPARFIVTATLPPVERRNTDDPALQAEDRYVEMTLITVGR